VSEKKASNNGEGRISSRDTQENGKCLVGRQCHADPLSDLGGEARKLKKGEARRGILTVWRTNSATKKYKKNLARLTEQGIGPRGILGTRKACRYLRLGGSNQKEKKEDPQDPAEWNEINCQIPVSAKKTGQ